MSDAQKLTPFTIAVPEVGRASPLRVEACGTGALDRWDGRVDVPTGYAVYPGEILQTPRVWAEKRYNLVHYTHQERGGHFAAFEQPALFAADLNAYAMVLQSWTSSRAEPSSLS